MPISATNLNKAYLAYFGRPADAVGQAYFATLEQADVIKAFDASAESKAIYGGDTAAKINAIYKNLFNREAEPAGLTYWLSLVSSGRVTPAGAAFSILEGAQGTDKTAIDNKLAASEAFIKAMDTTTEIVNYSGLNAAASARAFLATVDASAASLTAAVAGAEAAVTSAISSTGSEASSDNVLKTTQDILSGTSGNDTFRGVAGRNAGTQDQTTLNSSDILDGGAGADTLIVNMTGATYDGGARIKNIETLQIGTNQAAATFDYNINAGVNEVTEVTTIVADQINNGTVNETLTINNIVRTVVGDARVMPTLSWVNDSNTAAAGTVSYNYRAAELTGTTDTQIVSLDSVNNGTLNLAAGIETVTLRSVAGERVTLLNSGNADTGPGNNAVAADIVSSGSLARVNIEAAAEVGKLGGRAGNGLIDNAAQTGFANTGTGENLLSVGSRVTTVDANTSTANVNVQFLAKTDGAATNVTFTGGAGNDYAEFEIGNVTATGNAGSDTFAFMTQRNGVTNSTFGSGDTIAGGAGTDTVQIGSNGAGNYDVASSEFLNKTGVDVLDLRGAVNTVSVSAGFAAQTDGAALNITTDAIVVGGTAPSDLEAATVNTINLRELNPGQAINFDGGQGSDRLVLKDNVYTDKMDLDGGLQTNAAGVAAAGDYDTLTVVNTAVLDRTDLSNTRNFEGLNLVKDVVGAAQFTVELTEAFMLANTAAVNSLTTSIDDRVFQIGSVASPFAGANALVGTDLVKIDVTDLFNTATNTLKASVAGRQIDTNGMPAAIQYVYAGVTYNTLAALQAVVGAAGVVPFQGADAGRAGVIGAGAPGAVVVPTANVAIVAGATVTGTVGTNDNFTGTIAQLGTALTTVTGTVADTESLTVTDAGAVVIPAGVTNMDVINLANGVNTLTGAVATGATTINGGTGVDTLVLGADNITGITLNSMEIISVAAATATMTVAQHANAVVQGGAGATAVTFTGAGGAFTGATGVESYTAAATTSGVTATLVADQTGTVTGSGFADTFNTTVANLAAMNVIGSSIDGGLQAAGTADVLNITGGLTAAISLLDVNGVAGGNQAVVGIETLNLSGASTANALTVLDASGLTTINASGVTGGGVTVDLNALTTANGNTIVTLSNGNDVINTSITKVANANTLTINLGTGNATITDVSNAVAIAAGQTITNTTFQATNTAGSTSLITFAATSDDLAAGVTFDFNSDVASLVAAGVNGNARQAIVTTNAAGNTTILFDVNGDTAFGAGDIQVVITGQVLTTAGLAIVGGNLVLV